MACGNLFDLFQLEVDRHDKLTPKTLPRTEHEVDWMTRGRDIIIWNFQDGDQRQYWKVIKLEITPFYPSIQKTVP